MFGDHEKPDYPDSPKAPPGFENRVANPQRRPGRVAGRPCDVYLRAHSSPDGLVFYRGGELPKRYENSFFVARFGNLVGFNRIGFDVLNFRLEEQNGKLVAHTESFLERLTRPVDLCASGGKLYVVEYCRQNETQGPGSEGYTEGGRVLEAAGSRPK